VLVSRLFVPVREALNVVCVVTQLNAAMPSIKVVPTSDRSGGG